VSDPLLQSVHQMLVDNGLDAHYISGGLADKIMVNKKNLKPQLYVEYTPDGKRNLMVWTIVDLCVVLAVSIVDIAEPNSLDVLLTYILSYGEEDGGE